MPLYKTETHWAGHCPTLGPHSLLPAEWQYCWGPKNRLSRSSSNPLPSPQDSSSLGRPRVQGRL